MAVYYDSIDLYIESASSLQAKIASIDTVITGLLTAATKAAAGQNIQDYSLDTGQSKVRINYKDADSIYKSIKGFEKLKEYYVNELNGNNISRAVDSRNLQNPCI